MRVARTLALAPTKQKPAKNAKKPGGTSTLVTSSSSRQLKHRRPIGINRPMNMGTIAPSTVIYRLVTLKGVYIHYPLLYRLGEGAWFACCVVLVSLQTTAQTGEVHPAPPPHTPPPLGKQHQFRGARQYTRRNPRKNDTNNTAPHPPPSFHPLHLRECRR